MKNKIILSSFWAFLVVAIFSRFFQVAFTLEYPTGFFKKGFEFVGYVSFAVIALCCVVVAFFAFKAYKGPKGAPKQNILLRSFSLVFAITLALEIFKEKPLETVLPWQQSALKILGVATVCFFVAFALLNTNIFNKIKLFSVVPLMYFLVRLICCFIAISYLAITSDNVLQIASYSMVVLFLLNFAKLYNGIESDVIFRKVLATGLISSLLLLVNAVPNIILNFAKNAFNSSVQLVSSFSFVFLAIFILVFVFSYFAPKNFE